MKNPQSLDVICEIGLTEQACIEKYMCCVCPYNKNSPKYDLESVNIYKEGKLIAKLATEISKIGPDAEGIRIRW